MDSWPTLVQRGIFGSSKDNQTCARPISGEHGDNLSIGIPLQKLLLYMSAALLGLTALNWLVLTWKHLHRYSSPQQQRQIIRIIFLPLLRCILSFVSIVDYSISIELEPIGSAYEGFCIAALFLLYLDYVCPDKYAREDYFGKMDNVNRRGKTIAGGGMMWFKKTFMMVLQYPVTKTILSIIEIITQAVGVYCTNSLSPKHAHLWVELIGILVIGGAVGACIRFQRRLKGEMAPKHHSTAKLWTFKGYVAVGFLLMILFGLLNGKVFSATATATYDDIYYGIPNLITCFASFVFSSIFHWSFSSREYHHTESEHPRIRTFKAVVDAVNLSDVIVGVVDAFRLLATRGMEKYGAQGSVGPQRQKTGNIEVDNMHLEPLGAHQWRRQHGPVEYLPEEPRPSAQIYRPPPGPPPGSYSSYSGASDSVPLNPGYEQYGASYRDPSPSGPRTQSPRDMV